jgi:hypothetical protein
VAVQVTRECLVLVADRCLFLLRVMEDRSTAGGGGLCVEPRLTLLPLALPIEGVAVCGHSLHPAHFAVLTACGRLVLCSTSAALLSQAESKAAAASHPALLAPSIAKAAVLHQPRELLRVAVEAIGDVAAQVLVQD